MRITRSSSAASLVAGALLLAGCGGGSGQSGASSQGGGSPYGSSAPPATTSSAASSSRGLTIATANGATGTYLVGAGGRAIYVWAADTGTTSRCAGACAKAWPPVLAAGGAHAGSGVNAGALATVARPGGTKQVTYMGHPLYYFVADTAAGSTKGQGSDSFGAKWWLVAPSGSAITRTAGATSSTTTRSYTY